VRIPTTVGRNWLILPLLGLSVFLLDTPNLPGAGQKERDIFDYESQKAAKGVKRIVFIADTAPHGARGNHEFVAAAIYFARQINAHYPNAYAVVHLYTNEKGKDKREWPKDLKHADTIIVLLNHSKSAINPEVDEAIARGAGFMAIHYGVEVDKGVQGDRFLKWIGGYFEPFWSVNPFWTAEYKELPKHEVTKGVKPFTINDEWYYHMRFVDKMEGVTPILSALPPLSTIKDKGEKPEAHASNPDAYKDIAAGNKQVMAWAYVRPDGGRGFGFTGLHKHSNLGDDNFRTLLLNAVAWVSKLHVPENGVTAPTLSRQDLEQLIDEAKTVGNKKGS
jgi:hypothetical protein